MIILKNPNNGEKIDLLTDEQLKFLKTDRSDIQMENFAHFDYLDLKKHDNEDCTFPRKVMLEWEAGRESVIQISEDESFNSYYSKSGNNLCCLENLKCNTRYFWRVVCDDEISDTVYFDTADKFPRFIKIDGLTNVRDCGGWKTVSGKRIRQGVLYRGSEMNSHLNITDAGIKTMRETLKIKSVLDLRGKTENVQDVCKVKYLNIPVKAYNNWFDHPDSTRKIFEFLAEEENYPVYFHCWGGADRTGTLTFLIGAVLGQSYNDLIDDYEITSLSIYGLRTRNSKDHYQKFYEILNAFEGDTIQEKVKTYLLSCGVSETLIKKFRKIMLE